MGATAYETGDLDVFVEALVKDFEGMQAVDGLSRDAIVSVLDGLGVPNNLRGDYRKSQIVKVAVRLTAEFEIVKEFEVEIDGDMDSDTIANAVDDLYIDADEIIRDEVWDADLVNSDYSVEDWTNNLEDSLV